MFRKQNLLGLPLHHPLLLGHIYNIEMGPAQNIDKLKSLWVFSGGKGLEILSQKVE